MEKGLTTGCAINCIINKQRARLDGTGRLYLRITITKGGDKKIPLPLYWPIEHFDSKKFAIQPRMRDDPDYLQYQALIELERAKYWRVVKRLLLDGRSFTIDDILRGVLLGEKGRYLGTWMAFKIKERLKAKEIKERTALNCKGAINILYQYAPQDVDISLIDTKWLNKFMGWLLKRMSYSAAWTRVKEMKGYIKLAEQDGVPIHPDFKNHHLAEPDEETVFLEEEEVKKIFALTTDPLTIREIVDTAKAFLFACFTGLRISDLKRFDETWIQGDSIVFVPAKQRITKQKLKVMKVPLIPVANEFLKHLDGRKLPIPTDQEYNRRLKDMARAADIDKNITSHVARHTFGTSLAVLGVPVVVISELMGHAKVATTMKYIHIAKKVKEREMEKLQAAFASYTLGSSAITPDNIPDVA